MFRVLPTDLLRLPYEDFLMNVKVYEAMKRSHHNASHRLKGEKVDRVASLLSWIYQEG